MRMRMFSDSRGCFFACPRSESCKVSLTARQVIGGFFENAAEDAEFQVGDFAGAAFDVGDDLTDVPVFSELISRTTSENKLKTCCL